MKTLQLCIVLITVISFPAFSQSQLDKASQSIAQQIAKSVITKGKNKIAIVEFSYFTEKTTALDKLLTERVATKLYLSSNDKFRIIERMLLDKILEEHELEYSGLLEPSKSQRIGKILGIDAIVTGTIAKDGDNLVVNARLIDFETGEWLGAAEENIPYTGTVKELYSTILSRSKPSLEKPNSEKYDFSKEISGVTLSIKKCEFIDAGITCDLEFLSSNDVLVSWHRSGFIHDTNGHTYGPARVSVGNSNSRRHQLMENIRTSGSLIFDNVSPRPDLIALLKFDLRIGESRNVFKFKKIPVMR